MSNNNTIVQRSIVKKNINDPSYFGPGVWDSISIISCIKKKSEMKHATKFIKRVLLRRKCKCSKHIEQHLMEDPIENCGYEKDDKGRIIGLAKWVWRFHNSVNLRLGKELYEWSSFVENYLDEDMKPCSIE